MKALLLSPKQSKFVQAIVKGATYGEAYRRAGFDLPAGPKGDLVARSNGSRLVTTNENVLSAIKLAREEAMAAASMELHDLVLKLEDCRRVALEVADPPQVSAAVAAVMGIGKLLGLAVDRSEVLVEHKPARLPTALVELSQDEWQRQFDPAYKQLERTPEPRSDFFD